jgi:hypothetical protein
LISLLSSMWIDTGARPDRASFMLSAAVFRGVSMEGGCYPAGGSESMARELVPVIEVGCVDLQFPNVLCNIYKARNYPLIFSSRAHFRSTVAKC